MKESFIKNRKGILLMIVSSFCACIGQLFWKLSVAQGVLLLLIGFVFYAIGALIMLIAYKFGSLSVLQPILSLNYVLSIILAAIVLHESISVSRLIGVVIVMIGVILIGGGDD
jgi:drug/metabolite transporter (DMT)-like permease